MDLSQYTLDLVLHVDIKRPKEAVFEGVLQQITDEMRYPDGTSMNHKLEPWPGGRWYRDLGDNTGHLWGNVQSIKPPTLIEITGQMFMSYPVSNHLEFKVTEIDGGARLTLRHRAFGLLDAAHREGVSQGWGQMLTNIQQQLER